MGVRLENILPRTKAENPVSNTQKKTLRIKIKCNDKQPILQIYIFNILTQQILQESDI